MIPAYVNANALEVSIYASKLWKTLELARSEHVLIEALRVQDVDAHKHTTLSMFAKKILQIVALWHRPRLAPFFVVEKYLPSDIAVNRWLLAVWLYVEGSAQHCWGRSAAARLEQADKLVKFRFVDLFKYCSRFHLISSKQAGWPDALHPRKRRIFRTLRVGYNDEGHAHVDIVCVQSEFQPFCLRCKCKRGVSPHYKL